MKETETYRDQQIEAAINRLDDAVRRTKALLDQQSSWLANDAARARQRVTDMLLAKDEPLDDDPGRPQPQRFLTSRRSLVSPVPFRL